MDAARRLDGKVAVVTGAGRGIGYAIGMRLASEGAHVVVAEIDPVTVVKAAEDFSQVGPEAMAYHIDIADIEGTRLMVKNVAAKYGRIDILVNNAGISTKASLLDMTPELWDEMQNVNVRGLLFTTQAVTRQMIAQIPEKTGDQAPLSNGKIINLSSIAGRRGRPDAIHYSTSKAAVITITQACAMELAPYRINVNAICPSVVWTPLWEELDRVGSAALGMPPGEFFNRRIARIPLKRAGTAEEIAAMTAFLCSDEADYITAQTFNVDGGSEMN